MTQKTNPLNLSSLYQHIKSMFFYHDHGFGMLVLFSVIVLLSFFAGIPLKQAPPIFIAGEVASENVIANKEIIIEDKEATRSRHDQIRSMQPLIFDVNRQSVTRVREDILSLLHTLNTSISMNNNEKIAKIVEAFNTTYNTNLDISTFQNLASVNTQEYTFNTLLPWIERHLILGVLPDMRVLSTIQSSITVRDIKNNTESLYSIRNGLLDMRALIVALGNKIRTDNELSADAQVAIMETFPKLLLPTLAINQDASNAQVEKIISTTEPILYHINRGEILVNKGDRVTRIVQLKMQTLFENTHISFDFLKSFGIFCLGLTFMFGLYMTPSGTKGRILHTKDQLFIAVILLIVGGSVTFLSNYNYTITGGENNLIPYAFPIAGIAGLSVLIFSARRYCVFGLLLAFYATLLFNAEIELFLFYFLSSMMSTWLILRTQSRQDVVWSTIPLLLWLLFIGFASTFVNDLPPQDYTYLAILLFINAILSVFILFALSPVLEMLFGYTTRFRLMELLSLDHPLLQELMVKIPGTYHHALIVSNLVESGAKAIGANSLLVKVGALYHDIGKLARPEYFAENQCNQINPHDKLSPAMSCLILFSHVKHGVELAQKHRLGHEISDMIQQHHGTRLPAAFFHKAVQLGENPQKADFCYSGPRPQTKESAILMMADTVEAAIRSMGDPSPARIHNSISMLIKNIYAEGQLDETDLTFKDLNKLIDSFTRSLTGFYHQRITYPDLKKNSDSKTELKTESIKTDKPTADALKSEIQSENTPSKTDNASEQVTSKISKHTFPDTETTNMLYMTELSSDPQFKNPHPEKLKSD